MIRRRASIVFLLTLLILPNTAGALPREACPTPDSCVGVEGKGDSWVSVQQLSVSADGSTQVTAPLIKGVPYRFRVTGTWNYSSNSSHKADAAYSTTDNWSSGTKVANGRSIEIAGEKMSNAKIPYSSSHQYNIERIAADDAPVAIRIHDDVFGDGNSGWLSVEIFRAQRVVYSGDSIVPIGLATTDLPKTTLVPQQNIDLLPGTVVPVPGIPLPGVARVGTLTGEARGNGYCFSMTTPQTGEVPAGGVCLPNLFNIQGKSEFHLGPLEPTTVCGNGSCNQDPQPFTVGPYEIGPYSIPDQFWPLFLGERPFKPGSGIRIEVSWQADRDHLFLAASALGGPSRYSSYLPYDYSSSSETNWFLSNRDRLAAKINIAILFPDGTFGPPDGEQDPSYILPGGINIPGMGQYLEAAFSSRVAGQ